MEVNKVQLANGEVLVDLTNDSVTKETLAEGETAHDASGVQITGTMKRGGGASVQADWNQTDKTAADFIKNKPIVIGGGDTLTWDGDVTGREYVDVDGMFFVHVSDATPTAYDLANGSTFSVFLYEVGQSITGPITGEDIFEGTGFLMIGSYIVIVADDGVEAEGFVFPKKGVYFVYVPEVVYISGLTIIGYTGFTKEYIDPEYLQNNQLYADGTYLYKTSDISNASNRLTKLELKDYAMKNASIKVVVQGEAVFGVFFASNVLFLGDDPFGSVSVYFNSGYQTLYTAEYTPETT